MIDIRNLPPPLSAPRSPKSKETFMEWWYGAFKGAGGPTQHLRALYSRASNRAFRIALAYFDAMRRFWPDRPDSRLPGKGGFSLQLRSICKLAVAGVRRHAFCNRNLGRRSVRFVFG